MSNINFTGIAASVSQSLLQQKQVARANDADRNRKQEAARKLLEQAEHNARAVEDSAKASDEKQPGERQPRPRRIDTTADARAEMRQFGRMLKGAYHPDAHGNDHHVDVEA